ncbi:hypothetical protein DSCO28_07940 [Desulfosarcina ovata subsp. sediminis]|uniref:Uncharacterized protein n=1 Tax=Desulfosarcina ovata subsp. sediminis TaxID=885957 RepID=A0A5K7ZDG2_9BACT|nr:hypothetical protein [Desulfosarcina ovata]BBO80228.1 hypothetical protein DSCO28_07940 [Desulfosarcina ovata subsp. sediminis]
MDEKVKPSDEKVNPEFREQDSFDIDQKREDLLALWSDVFDLCKGIVESAKKGDLTVRASLLKEIVTYLKLSSDVLDKAAQRQREKLLEQEEEDREEEMLEEMDSLESEMMEEFEQVEREMYGPANPQAEPLA